MKYALFIDKLKNGGAERVASILANYFASKEDNMVCIYVVDAGQIDYLINKRVRVIEVPYDENKLRRMWKRALFVKKEIEKVEYDVCISLTYTFLAYIIWSKRAKRGKVIGSLRNAPQYEMPGAFPRTLRWLAFSMCDKIVFQTPDAKDYFSNNISRKGVVIPNPLSENLPYIDKNRNKTVVMACRLEKQKNIPLALLAFKEFYQKHGDWRMEIYGRGGALEECQKIVEKDQGLVKSVVFKGFTSDIHTVMKQSGIYLSTSDFEGLSNSMIETMAIGLPVVCTDCPIGGARMMIEDGVNGILVPVGDAKKIADALSFFADNEERANIIGHNAMKVREKLSMDTICHQWDKVI